MNNLGTIVRGIRTPLIKEGDDLLKITIDSLINASKDNNFKIENNDVLAITESVVSISQGKFIKDSEIALEISSLFKSNKIGILFPILSRNRFAGILKGIAKTKKNLIIQLSYPFDEVGNGILYEDKLKELKINPYSDFITEKDYMKYFSNYMHPYTGLNMIEYYKKICEDEGSSVEFILSNNPTDILKYTNDVLVSNIHQRNKDKNILKQHSSGVILGLDDISTNKNKHFGLLGSNLAKNGRLKLFPDFNDQIVYEIKNKIKELTNKDIHVLIYGDGAFKDPSSGIWELADPLVSPSYTKGLEGTPNEVKLKYVIDSNNDKNKEELKEILKEKIKEKSININDNTKLGTTPRKLVDLLGTLADLTSGSGDKGTPLVYIQNYFKSYTD